MGQFVNNLLSNIGNFVLAIVILILALVIAAVAKSLVLKALSALKFEEKLAKLKVEGTAVKSAYEFVGKLVWFIVFLLFLPGVFSRLGLDSSITSPITSLVSTFLGCIPKIVGAGIILAVGVFAADLVRQILVPVLKSTKIDKVAADLGVKALEKSPLSVIIADIVKYVLLIFFAVQAIRTLGLSELNSVGTAIIGYIPSVIAAVVILIAAVLSASALEKLINKTMPKAKGAVITVKVVVYVLAGFMILSQLGLSSYIVNTAFTLILAAACLASAIAFGIGGRDFAKHQLDKLEKKMDENN